MLRKNIAIEEFVIVSVAHQERAGLVLIGSECAQCLRHRKGPRGTVPRALIGTLEAKARAAPFRSCRSILAIETLRVEELLPCHRVRRGGNVEYPWDVADLLAHPRELHGCARVYELLLFADSGIRRGRQNL